MPWVPLQQNGWRLSGGEWDYNCCPWAPTRSLKVLSKHRDSEARQFYLGAHMEHGEVILHAGITADDVTSSQSAEERLCSRTL